MTGTDRVIAGSARTMTDHEIGFARDRLSLEPATAYEVVTRQMVLDMGEDLREIKSRLNGLLFMVAGAVVLEVITRMMGHG
jgi:hypothetical protein